MFYFNTWQIDQSCWEQRLHYSKNVSLSWKPQQLFTKWRFLSTSNKILHFPLSNICDHWCTWLKAMMSCGKLTWNAACTTWHQRLNADPWVRCDVSAMLHYPPVAGVDVPELTFSARVRLSFTDITKESHLWFFFFFFFCVCSDVPQTHRNSLWGHTVLDCGLNIAQFLGAD